MNPSFEGWVQRYCQALTGLKTTSVKKLVRAVEGDAPHAAEAVFFYAAARGRLSDLLRYSTDEDLKIEWCCVADIVSNLADWNVTTDDEWYRALPVRYQKVIDGYASIKQEKSNDQLIKTRIAEKVVGLLHASDVSRYRLCHDLGLNEGNFYAWLAGDPTKVSRDTAVRAWERAQELAASR